jgi:hypothetical protein
VDVNAAAWCILRKVDGLFPKTKAASDEAGLFGDKTPLNRRIVRSMIVAGRAEEKYIGDDEHSALSRKKKITLKHVTCTSLEHWPGSSESCWVFQRINIFIFRARPHTS